MSTHDLFEQRKNFYLEPSAAAKGAVATGVAVGLVTFVAGMWFGEHTRTWGALLFNLFFFFSIALGGVAFGGMQDVVGAVWARPIRRLHESFAAFLPVAAILFVAFFLAIRFGWAGADGVYDWIKEPDLVHHYFGKHDWLQRDFMLIRNALAIGVILALSFWQLKQSLRRDLLLVSGDQAGATKEGQESKLRLRHWSAPILVTYALCFSMLAFDLLMSLSYKWFSTLFAGWLFAIMMQTLLAMMMIFMFAYRKSNIGALWQRQQFHDVGKMMHGFTIFFAYLTYAHILTYWYGNMPEETEYYLHRLHSPWIYIVIATPILGFIVPLYSLLVKSSKWTAGVAVPLSLMILLAQWMTNLIVVIPEVLEEGSHWGMPWIEVGLFCGVLGLFLGSVFRFGKRFPMVAIADPLLPDALSTHH